MDNKVPLTEFVGFPKIARLARKTTVSEKIDGTNAQIAIVDAGCAVVMLCGSRTRWITPDDDNHGFAAWAYRHMEELVAGLGVGRHFGEWWGSGINRGYGLPKGEKRFSLFNTERWCLHGQEPRRIETGDPQQEKYQQVLPPCIGLVPVLYEGPFDLAKVDDCLKRLDDCGSVASPGFKPAEGVVVFHHAANMCFKKTILNDDKPKSKGAK